MHILGLLKCRSSMNKEISHSLITFVKNDRLPVQAIIALVFENMLSFVLFGTCKSF